MTSPAPPPPSATRTPSPVRLVRHPDAAAFLRDAQADLERREAEHNMMLGSALAMRAEGSTRYFATVRGPGGLALAAMLTPPFPLALAACGAGAGADAAMDPLVGDLLAAGLRPGGVFAADPLAERFAERWTLATGEAGRLAFRQRLYALAGVQPVPDAPGEMRRAGEDDVERVAGWMAAFDAEALGEGDAERARAAARQRIAAGEVWLWTDGGEARTMAASARPTRHGVAVNAVYTPPEWRGRGYATACVAALSRRLLAEGRRFCVLYTDLANPTSNSIYLRIGYRPLEDSTLVRFGG